MARSFVHLHLHSEFSLLDGLGRIPDYLAQARLQGMEHIALTDHGVLYGIIEWYKAAKAEGIHPILGMEAYLAPRTVQDRDKTIYHLLLLAENEQGYKNLLKLATRASLEGFYYKPRIDLAILAEHRDGLIVTSACLGGPLASNLLLGDREAALSWALRLREIFGPDHFFVELQDHGLPEQKRVNPQLVALARQLDLPLVVTNDVHYLRQEDAAIQDLLLCIQTNSTIHDPKRLRAQTDQLYLKSPEEMWRLFGAELPNALSNTVRIAERCHLELEFGRLHLPDPGVPAGMTADQYLAQLSWEGIQRRYPVLTEEIRRRLEYELAVIQETGFARYLLIVRDLADFARRRGILYGVRGSAAASIVLYALGITEVDPLANRLVFERFLNPERREMPDIDMDFADDRRHEVIEYVAQKYGAEHVAQIITFGTMGAKAAIRDVGRALGWPYADVDRIARLVLPGVNAIDRALKESPELRALYETDSRARELLDQARQLEGLARHAGTHAAGVVISASPLVEHVPLQRPARAEEGALPTTQFPMETVAEIGLLKMDFLGLANLTILADAVELIRQTRGVELDLKSIPMNDRKTFQLLSEGQTFGVFQLESAGMRRYIRELRPESVSELAAMIALYRPGPIQHIPTYCRAKHGLEPIQYPHPDLAEILDETYGVIVYQDQVLLIARKFAGYTLGEADIMRKAMGKKIPEKMRAERERFIAGAKERGYSEEDAERIFNLIEPFAGYAFNKAHATSYALLSYQTAYLKANFPVEFLTAVLRNASSHPSGTVKRVAAALAECQKLGIPVLPPDINRSEASFTVEKLADGSQAIRFGLAMVKQVGEVAAQAVVAARGSQPGGQFASFEHFCQAIDWSVVNRRAVESLIKCGALDRLGERGVLLAQLDQVVQVAQARQKALRRGQQDLFAGTGGSGFGVVVAHPQVEAVEIPQGTLLRWERELLGVYLSAHPLDPFAPLLRQRGIVQLAELDEESVGQVVEVLGLVARVRKLTTRSERVMVVLELEDRSGSIEVVVFPDLYEREGHLIQQDALLLVQARVEERAEMLQLVAQSLTDSRRLLTRQADESALTVHLRLPRGSSLEADIQCMQQIRDHLCHFPGEDRLLLHLPLARGEVILESGLAVDWCDDFARVMTGLVGPNAVWVTGRAAGW